MGLTIGANSGGQKLNIVIIGDYANKKVCVDPYDNIPDISNGEVAELFIKAQDPNINIIRMGKVKPITEKGKAGFDSKGSLKELDNYVKSGAKIDTVDFSATEIDTTFESLSNVLNKKITKENVNKYRNEIRELISNDDSPEMKDLNEKLKYIEDVTSKGISFYVAAGDSGPEHFNLYTVAKGVTTVGASDYYSNNNSLVQKYEQSVHSIKQIKDRDGKITGYNITGNNESEIPAEKTSSEPSKSIWGMFTSLWGMFFSKKVDGTIVSTATLVGKELKEKNKK